MTSHGLSTKTITVQLWLACLSPFLEEYKAVLLLQNIHGPGPRLIFADDCAAPPGRRWLCSSGHVFTGDLTHSARLQSFQDFAKSFVLIISNSHGVAEFLG
jgi:hypothetical protein